MDERNNSAISAADIALITEQLGREPRGIVSIAARSENGVPLALQMRSILGNQPFPTLFWLCSKDLAKALGTLETRGVVKELEQKLSEDSAFRTRYLADQERYVALRWQAMTDSDRQRIEQLGFSHLFDQYGIGGIAQWDKVRCLHMQYAHHLADNNTIGRWLDQHYHLDQLPILR